MNRTALAVALAAAVLLPLVAALAQEPHEPEPAIHQLDWLAGTWSGPHEGGVWEASYSDAKGGVILGVDKELDGRGRLKMFEFERFFQRGDDVVLVPYPNGKGSVEFLLEGFEPAEERARFVNHTHGFPQEIVFERDGDALAVSVGNPEGEKLRGFRLELRRRD